MYGAPRFRGMTGAIRVHGTRPGPFRAGHATRTTRNRVVLVMNTAPGKAYSYRSASAGTIWEACRAGNHDITSAATIAMLTVVITVTHGTSTSTAMPPVVAGSLTRFHDRTSPRIAPDSDPRTTTTAVSITKARATVLVWKPSARSMPICCRRSTTARYEITPTAATPTIM